MYNNNYGYNGNNMQMYQGNPQQRNDYSNAVYPQYQMQSIPSMQTAQQTALKGRPVSSYDEAKASMIDFDGSLFVFTDIANKCIYTKQIALDGSAELKTYVLQEKQEQAEQLKEPQQQKIEYVSKEEFEQRINEIKEELKNEYESVNAKNGRSNVRKQSVVQKGTGNDTREE